MTSCCVNKPFAVHTAASTDFHWLSPEKERKEKSRFIFMSEAVYITFHIYILHLAARGAKKRVNINDAYY